MEHEIMNKNECWVACFGMFVLWWLVASALLWQCWNRVIAKLFSYKTARYSQALLLIATIAIFLAPCAYMKKKHCWSGKCGYSQDCDSGNCKHKHKKGSDNTSLLENNNTETTAAVN
jgi:hypothetical protein